MCILVMHISPFICMNTNIYTSELGLPIVWIWRDMSCSILHISLNSMSCKISSFLSMFEDVIHNFIVICTFIRLCNFLKSNLEKILRWKFWKIKVDSTVKFQIIRVRLYQNIGLIELSFFFLNVSDNEYCKNKASRVTNFCANKCKIKLEIALQA